MMNEIDEEEKTLVIFCIDLWYFCLLSFDV